MDGGELTIEGLHAVLKGLESKRAEINRAASYGLRCVGMEIIADAQQNLQENHSWVTGLLANSGRVIYGGKGYDTGSAVGRTSREASDSLLAASEAGADIGLDAGFFDRSSGSEGYAAYVEYGRKAGKMPPPSALEEWVYKKLRVRDRKEARSISWAMAVKISREGTRPHAFFVPAVRKYTDRIISILSEAIGKVTK
jgi:hypothetical protein